MSDFLYVAFDAVMPTAAIYILRGGASGPCMWAKKIPLERARTLIRSAAIAI